MLTRLNARRVLLALAAALLLPAACGGAVAQAGTYTVHSCQTPDGAAAPIAGWTFTTNVARINELANRCPGGGMVLRMLPEHGHPSTDAAGLMFDAPSSTRIVRYRIWRSVRMTPTERYYYAGMETVPGGENERVMDRCGGVGANRDCSTIGDRRTPLSAANLVDRTPPRPLARYGMYLSCGHFGDGAPDCRAVSPVSAEATIWRAETTLSDEIAPTLATEPAGSLRNADAALSGTHTLSTIAGDRGGGVLATSLEVDGAIVSRQTFGDGAGTCREPYVAVVPCPTTASGTFSLDTTTLADGAHQLRVLVTDVAGNVSSWGPVAFTTDNSRTACDPEPAAAPGPRMDARLAPEPRGRSARAPAPRRRITVPMRRGTRLTARLTDAAGAPVAGAPVCVATRPTDDAPLTIVARAATDGDGRVDMAIPAGTSRQVWAIHRTGATSVAGKAVVRVRAGVTLRPNRKRLRGRQRLTMRGRLSGRPIPRRGVLVNIQAKQGRRWRTFRQVRVGRSGRFVVRYRFSGAPGVHRYALRAAVPAQGDYHYAPAASRAFHVRVAG